LPPEEGRPLFLVVVDIGTVIEVYDEFSRSGGTDIRSRPLAATALA
jgi:hypothetical protein